MTSEVDLAAALRRYWGYDTFRPLQERVVHSLLAGHDVAVIMPTGGGKSLCYQLPALIMGRTALVISPLIALMQDQAAQLSQMGIPAAFLNSSLAAEEQNRVIREAVKGAYRLLYMSPERLVRPDTLTWLARVPIMFFAIDEAHCISEWGHEFRPEYRQLSRLREAFPDKPIAAFTASATQRVRHDILHQLRLRTPDKYIASFHRPNLRYVVRQCDKAKTQNLLLVAALRAHAGCNVIVYASTIAQVEQTVDFLAAQHIDAVPYHGQMDTGLRKENQERWMSDEVRVLVGTLAFGLGINKPSVRAVIHLALPKSVEQYYQEAGRAGRDGLPADCVLLWRARDAGILAYFIQKVEDPDERERSWQRYHEIRRFVESGRCRHLQICNHFGQTPKWTACGMCDVCAPMPVWMSVEAEAEAEPPLLAAAPRPVLEEGEESAVSPEMMEYLREWRRELARRNEVAAYIVLHDTSLEELCRLQPRNRSGLLQITGIGERKADLYGTEILAALERFRQGARAAAKSEKEKKISPSEETMRMLAEGKTFIEIAQIRGRQVRTVVETVGNLVEKGELEFDPAWIPAERRSLIEEQAAKFGLDRLKPLKDALPEDYSYDEIKLVVANLRRRAGQPAPCPPTSPCA